MMVRIRRMQTLIRLNGCCFTECMVNEKLVCGRTSMHFYCMYVCLQSARDAHSFQNDQTNVLYERWMCMCV